MLSTPRRRLRREIGLLRSAPPWLRPLAEGEPDALRTLGRALKGYFDAALAPCWTAIRAEAEADRALRARPLLTGGHRGAARQPRADPGLPPVLVYPVRRGPGWWSPQGERTDGRSSLGSLLGRGRAAVLRAVEGGCTTSELARRTGVTPATASEHARILRDAGLLASVRDRNTVLHTPTPLGTDLLAANSPGG